ncbi:hypothetical protein RFI_31733, partial [Reticulomyxa filosa]
DSQNAKKKRTLQKTFLGQTTLECPSKRRKLQQVAITEDAVPDPWRERFCRNVERKISRVGNNYQATIPSLQCNSKDIGGVLIKTEDIQKQACSVPPESCNNLNYKEKKKPKNNNKLNKNLFSFFSNTINCLFFDLISFFKFYSCILYHVHFFFENISTFSQIDFYHFQTLDKKKQKIGHESIVSIYIFSIILKWRDVHNKLTKDAP